jgi:signal transduction histidine kinase
MIADVLKTIPFFSHLSEKDLARLTEHGRVAACETGNIVVREGEIADSMYVILHGDVRVYKSDPNGTRIDIATLSGGSFFGELALLDEGARSATVRCLTPCGFFILHQSAFLNLLMTSDSNGIQSLFAALARRIRDTTERVFKEELARQTLEADMEIERLRSLSQMVAGVAHEINTPLGTINAAAGMIEKRISNPAVADLLNADPKAKRLYDEMLEAAEMIQRNIERAHRLVQDFKKISVQQLTDVRETVDLPETVRSIVDLFKINVKKSRLSVTLHNELTPGSTSWEGYPGYLTQVLLNLLGNVERYAYEPGTGGMIDIRLRNRTGKAPGFVITVCDQGAGIPAENLPRVFDPFFTTGRSKGGSGLGMAIVYNIVTSALHGDVSIESEVGQGTTVTVDIPQSVPA